MLGVLCRVFLHPNESNYCLIRLCGSSKGARWCDNKTVLIFESLLGSREVQIIREEQIFFSAMYMDKNFGKLQTVILTLGPLLL